ncbi:glycoprotein [Sawgrass virus]|uniref:Glycoprotein n=1 Tax=Sawgrass virus TaxID=1620896 RepID=A0A0D3R1L2_9RHAB|nr:glycoprotein [Sawgrass virus]AJR28511.1 glycoprotein [Sawgrass virus]
MLTHFTLLLFIPHTFGWEPELGEYWAPIPVTPWRPATKSDFSCPSLRVDPIPPLQLVNNTRMAYLMEGKARKEHPGWLCVRKMYQTTCDTNFWGHQTITHEELALPADQTECRQAIAHYIKGTYEDPRHPDPVCTWMAAEKVYNPNTALLPHSTVVDPFSYTFMDSLFPGTHCKTAPCPTVHPDVLWHTVTPLTEDCPGHTIIPIKIYNDKSARKKTHEWLSVSDGPLIPLGGSCSLTYCGQLGLRTPGGHWYPYPGSKRYPECKDAWRATPTFEGEGMRLDIELQEILARRECINVLQQIQSGAAPTFHMLSHFQPRHAGYYRAYRMKNNVIEYSLALYDPIFNVSVPPQVNFGAWQNGTRYYLPLVESGYPGTLSAFNGIHVMHNKTVVVPELELYKEHYAETLFYYTAQIAEHPSQMRQDNETELTPPTRTTITVKRPSIGGWLSSMWGSVWGKVTSAIGLVLAIFVIGLLIKILPWGRLLRRPSTPAPRTVVYTPATGNVAW